MCEPSFQNPAVLIFFYFYFILETESHGANADIKVAQADMTLNSGRSKVLENKCAPSLLALSLSLQMACPYIQVLNESSIRNSVFSVVLGLTPKIVYSGKVFASWAAFTARGTCLSVCLSLSLIFYTVTVLEKQWHMSVSWHLWNHGLKSLSPLLSWVFCNWEISFD